MRSIVLLAFFAGAAICVGASLQGCVGDSSTTSAVDASTDDASGLSDSSVPGATDGGSTADAMGAADAAVDAAPVDAGDAGPFSPTSIPSLRLWLRADDSASLTVAGGHVAAWLDRSPIGNDFTQLTAAAQPSVVANVGNGLPGVQFGGSQYLTKASALGINPGAERTVLVVVRLDGALTARTPIVTQSVLSGSGSDWIAVEANTTGTQGSLYGVYAAGSAYDSDKPTTGASSLHSFRLSTLSANASILTHLNYRFNGTSAALTLRGGTGLTGATLPTPNLTDLGAAAIGGTRNFGLVTIQEVLVYARALTDVEIINVEVYLKQKYAL